MNTKTQANVKVMQQRTGYSGRLLGGGLVLEVLGIIALIFAFGPERYAVIALGTLHIPYFPFAILITYLGMFIAFAGALNGIRAAERPFRRTSYLVAALGGAAQITGLTWDNVLHASGQTHFDPAHTLAIVGLVVIVLTALVLLGNTWFERRLNDER